MPVLALTHPTFQPAMRVISAIAKGNPTTVTTTFDHNYLDNEMIRLYVPRGFGMQQIDKEFAAITVTGATTFTIAIDSTSFDDFAIPAENPGHFYTQAQTVPMGTALNATNAQQIRDASKNVLREGR